MKLFAEMVPKSAGCINYIVSNSKWLNGNDLIGIFVYYVIGTPFKSIRTPDSYLFFYLWEL